jgi:hypothetical protein
MNGTRDRAESGQLGCAAILGGEKLEIKQISMAYFEYRFVRAGVVDRSWMALDARFECELDR